MEDRMNVLGIAGLADVESFLNQHFPAQMAGTSKIVQGMDAAAALICDGQVLAAVSEERFDRVKKSGAFPFRAIDYCLRTAGLRISDLSAVCGNFDFGRYSSVFGFDGTAKQYYTECLSPEAISN